MVNIYSIGGMAERLTECSAHYFAPWQIARVVRQLVEKGELPDRRAGRQRVIFADDIPKIAEALGVQMAEAANVTA